MTARYGRILFGKGGRQDLVEKETKEKEILEKYKNIISYLNSQYAVQSRQALYGHSPKMPHDRFYLIKWGLFCYKAPDPILPGIDYLNIHAFGLYYQLRGAAQKRIAGDLLLAFD